MSAADIAHALGDARREGRGWLLCRRGLLDGRATGYWGPSPQTSQREDVARTARALAIWHEARPAGVSIEIVGGSFTAIDIDGVVLGTFDTLREPTRAFPERGGMR